MLISEYRTGCKDSKIESHARASGERLNYGRSSGIGEINARWQRMRISGSYSIQSGAGKEPAGPEV
jgi:hypothetical protein